MATESKNLSHLMNPGQSADQMGGLIALVEYAK